MIDVKVVKEVRPEVPERPALWATAEPRDFGEYWRIEEWVSAEKTEKFAERQGQGKRIDIIRIPSEAEAKWAEERERLVEQIIAAGKELLYASRGVKYFLATSESAVCCSSCGAQYTSEHDERCSLYKAQFALDTLLAALDAHDAKKPGAE